MNTVTTKFYQLFTLTLIVCVGHDYLILAHFNAMRQETIITTNIFNSLFMSNNGVGNILSSSQLTKTLNTDITRTIFYVS